MKHLKKHKIKHALVIGSLLTTSTIAITLTACTTSYSDLFGKEIQPAIKPLYKAKLNSILAADFVKDFETMVEMPTSNQYEYKFLKAEVSAQNEDEVQVRMSVRFKNSDIKRTYVVVYGGFRKAANSRIQKANQAYLNDPKNRDKLYLTPELVDFKVQDLSVTEALNLPLTQFKFNNSDSTLKYTLRSISLPTGTNSIPNSVNLNIRVTKGENDQVAELNYIRTIQGFMSDSDKKKINEASVNDPNNQLDPIIDAKYLAKSTDIVLANKDWIQAPTKKGFDYKITDVAITPSDNRNMDITIEISAGIQTTKATATYKKTIKGFAPITSSNSN